jgi:hypothetical protein
MRVRQIELLRQTLANRLAIVPVQARRRRWFAHARMRDLGRFRPLVAAFALFLRFLLFRVLRGHGKNSV